MFSFCRGTSMRRKCLSSRQLVERFNLNLRTWGPQLTLVSNRIVSNSNRVVYLFLFMLGVLINSAWCSSINTTLVFFSWFPSLSCSLKPGKSIRCFKHFIVIFDWLLLSRIYICKYLVRSSFITSLFTTGREAIQPKRDRHLMIINITGSNVILLIAISSPEVH